MARWIPRIFDGEPSRPQPSATPAGPDAQVAAARESASALVGRVNRDAGRLPGEAVVVSRRILDLVVAALDQDRELLSTQTRLELCAVATDYLPTTLRTFEAAARDTPEAGARLLDQLDTVYSSVRQTCQSLDQAGAREFDVQGAFLSQRFSKDVL